MRDSVRNKTARISFIIIALMAFIAPAYGAYSLVWSDDFNGTSLNTADWTADVGDGCPGLCGWGNNELEYYRSQNVTVTGGNLCPDPIPA